MVSSMMQSMFDSISTQSGATPMKHVSVRRMSGFKNNTYKQKALLCNRNNLQICSHCNTCLLGTTHNPEQHKMMHPGETHTPLHVSLDEATRP